MIDEPSTPMVHDLLQLKSLWIESVSPYGDQPQWVSDALAVSPWVVVCRSLPSDSWISVGVRGNKRALRWAGFLRRDQVKQAVTPSTLRSNRAIGARRTLPAIQTLEILERELSCMNLPWGPGGSVGYELASGYPAVRDTSDLDLVIYSTRRIDSNDAQILLGAMRSLPAKVDVRIETSHCGFSLLEYVQSSSGCLVRTPIGPKFVEDPWKI